MRVDLDEIDELLNYVFELKKASEELRAAREVIHHLNISYAHGHGMSEEVEKALGAYNLLNWG